MQTAAIREADGARSVDFLESGRRLRMLSPGVHELHMTAAADAACTFSRPCALAAVGGNRVGRGRGSRSDPAVPARQTAVAAPGEIGDVS